LDARPYQLEAERAIFNEWASGNNRTLLVLPTGCHCRGQKVLRADGSTVKVENVRVGDRLIGADGKPRTVLHLTSGTDMLYKITPVKGEPFVVTGDHRLSLVRTNTDRKPKYPSEMNDESIKDVTVMEWISWSKSKKHLYKLIRSGCIKRFPDRAPEEAPIEPYVLGVLLGDGGLTKTISVTTPDKAIFDELSAFAKRYDMHLRAEAAGKADTYFFVCDDARRCGKRGSRLFRELTVLGLMKKGSADKFVPEAYKYGSVQTRKEIVAGLLDSDGSCTGSGYDFISKSKQLAEDLMFICRSLGLAAYMTTCRKGNQYGFSGIYFRLSISGDCSILPCRVKKAEKRRQKKSVLRTGFKFEEYGIGEYFGFTVDGDNRYLMDDFTITHNCGKTVVFANVAKQCVQNGERVLVLAHRGELLEQAADKILKFTGLMCATEKAEESCLGSWYRITVGSVQSLQREKRLEQFDSDYFDAIIIDEAHHCLSDGYQRVLEHFGDAHVLGVTATPDRGDMRNLGSYFDSLAYEYTLPQAIKDGYLAPIKALTIPLNLDLTGVAMQNGDFKAADIDNALDPYLYQIADEMIKNCRERKTVVFLPLIKTSQKFRDILNERGFKAAEVNGGSQDRAEIIEAFERGEYNVLCNSMLLTEGWDCPAVDCVIVLRPTKVRSLYSQMVGRGTRLAPGKKDLLLLDFLWHTERHELCHPAHLICESEEIAKKMTENIEAAGCPVDIEAAEQQAESDVVAQREEALAAQLKEMRKRKRKLVDPLQYEMSISAQDLSSYVPVFGYQMLPPSKEQIDALEKWGILPDNIDNAGKAAKLLNCLSKRRDEGLATPRQIRCLERYGFKHVGTWTFDAATKLIERIASNSWRIPHTISPDGYIPE
jgi:superfamily II DNA or RNA helicase